MKIRFSKLAALALFGVVCVAPGCTDFSSDINDLKTQVDNLTEQTVPKISSLEDQLKVLQGLAEQLDGRIEEAENDIADLKGDVETLQGVDKDLDKAIKALEKTEGDHYEEVKGLIGKIQEDIKDLNAKDTELETSINALDVRVTANENDIKTLKSDFYAFKSTVEGQISGLETRMNTAEAAIETLNKETIPAINQQINNIETELKKKADKSYVDSLRTEFDNYKTTTANTIEIIKDAIKALQDADVAILEDISDIQRVNTNQSDSLKTIFARLNDYVLTSTFNAYVEANTSALAAIRSDFDTRIKKDSLYFVEEMANLQTKLDKKIDSLDNALNKCIEELNSTFGEVIDGIQTEIDGINGDIEALTEKHHSDSIYFQGLIDTINGSIKDLEEADRLIDIRIKEVISSLELVDDRVTTLEGDVDDLDDRLTDLEDDVDNLTNRVKVNEDNIKKLQDALDALTGRVETLENDLDALTKRVDKIEVDVTALLSRVQSLVYVPEYNDGKANIYGTKLYLETEDYHKWIAIPGDTSVLTYKVRPEGLRDQIVEAFAEKPELLSFDVIEVKTRAGEDAQLNIVDVKAGEKDGTFDVYVRNSNFSATFFDVEDYNIHTAWRGDGLRNNEANKTTDEPDAYSASLILRDDAENHDDRTTEYTNLVGFFRTEIHIEDITTSERDSIEYISDTVITDFKEAQPYFSVLIDGHAKVLTLEELAALNRDVTPYLKEGTCEEKYSTPANKDLFAVKYYEGEEGILADLGMNNEKTASEKRAAVGDSVVVKKFYYLSDEELDFENIGYCREYRGVLYVTPVKAKVILTAEVEWDYSADDYADLYNDIIRHNNPEDFHGYTRTIQFKGALEGEENYEANMKQLEKIGVTLNDFYQVAESSDTITCSGNKTWAKIDNLTIGLAAEFHHFSYDEDSTYVATAVYPLYEKAVEGEATVGNNDAKPYAEVEVVATITTVDRRREPVTITLPVKNVELAKNTFNADGVYRPDTTRIDENIIDSLDYIKKHGVNWKDLVAIVEADQNADNGWENVPNILCNHNGDHTNYPAWLIPGNDQNNHGFGFNHTVAKGIEDSLTVWSVIRASLIDFTTKKDVTLALHDSICLDFGQKIYVDREVNFTLPKYNLFHNPYFVKYNGLEPAKDLGFDFVANFGQRPMSIVEPLWQNEKNVLEKFDVYKINLAAAFMPEVNDTHTPKSWAWAKEQGLSVKFDFLNEENNPESDGITFVNDSTLYYGGYDPYVRVTSDLSLNAGTEKSPVKVALPTRFDAACTCNDPHTYEEYIVCKYEPLFLDTTDEEVVVTVDDARVYYAEAFKGISLTDRRGVPCIDASDTSNSYYPWVMGNGLAYGEVSSDDPDVVGNGFADETTSREAYDATATIELGDLSQLDPWIANRISINLNNGVVAFNYDPQLGLQQLVKVPVSITIKHIWAVPSDTVKWTEYVKNYTKTVTVVFQK